MFCISENLLFIFEFKLVFIVVLLFIGFSGSSFFASSFLISGILGSSFFGSGIFDSSFFSSSFLTSGILGSSFIISSFLGSSFLGSSFLGSSFLVRASFLWANFPLSPSKNEWGLVWVCTLFILLSSLLSLLLLSSLLISGFEFCSCWLFIFVSIFFSSFLIFISSSSSSSKNVFLGKGFGSSFFGSFCGFEVIPILFNLLVKSFVLSTIFFGPSSSSSSLPNKFFIFFLALSKFSFLVIWINWDSVNFFFSSEAFSSWLFGISDPLNIFGFWFGWGWFIKLLLGLTSTGFFLKRLFLISPISSSSSSSRLSPKNLFNLTFCGVTIIFLSWVTGAKGFLLPAEVLNLFLNCSWKLNGSLTGGLGWGGCSICSSCIAFCSWFSLFVGIAGLGWFSILISGTGTGFSTFGLGAGFTGAVRTGGGGGGGGGGGTEPPVFATILISEELWLSWFSCFGSSSFSIGTLTSGSSSSSCFWFLFWFFCFFFNSFSIFFFLFSSALSHNFFCLASTTKSFVNSFWSSSSLSSSSGATSKPIALSPLNISVPII